MNISRDEYLQSFPEHIRGGYREDGTGYTEYADDDTEADLTYPLYFEALDSESGVRICTMKLRMISHSWMAAADYMRYVYLGSAVFVAACIVFAAYTLEKSYRKSAEAEAQRRDFTNAMKAGILSETDHRADGRDGWNGKRDDPGVQA